MILGQYLGAFAIEDEPSFVELMLKEIPPRPARAAEIRALNLGSTIPADA